MFVVGLGVVGPVAVGEFVAVAIVVVVGLVADPLNVDPASWALMAAPEFESVYPPLHWAQLTGSPWYMESNTDGPL